MSDLDLGTLTGFLELDESGVGEAVNRALDHVQRFARRGVVIAGAAGLAIAGAIGVSIAQGMDLEAGRDQLAAELGLTEADSARVGKISGQLFAQNYGDSMGEVNEAVSAVITSIDGMRNATSKAVQAATVDALNFAQVFDVDVNRAAQVAGQAIKMGLAENSREAFDLLITGAQRVPKALREDLLDAVDEYGPSFAQLGFSGKQAFAMLVDASEKGMYGIDKTGDAIKEFALLVSTDMTRTKPVIEGMGMDYDALATKLLKGGKSGQSATRDIVNGLLGIKDPAAQARAAVALFGTPIEDLNTAEIPAFLKSLKGGSDAMDGFGGASTRLDQTLNDNAIKSLGELKRQVTVAFYALGNWALPKVNDLSNALADNFGPALGATVDFLGRLWDALKSTVNFVDDNQQAFIIIAGVITALLIPAIVAWGVQATISAAKNVAAWLAAKVGALQSAAMQIVSLTLLASQWVVAGVQAMISGGRIAAAWLLSKAGVVGTMVLYGIAFAMMAAGWLASAAASVAGAAMMAASWLIAIWPIALVVAVIAGVVFLIIKYWDQIVAFTRKAWDWVSSKVSGAISWIVGFVRNNWPLLLAIITGPLGLIVLAVSKNLSRIRGFFSAAWNAIRGAARAAWAGITGIISGGAAAIMSAVRSIPGRLRGLASNFGSAGRALINAFVNGLKNAGGVISGIAGNVWSAVKSLLNGAISKINAALEFRISIPGPDIHINPPNIPQLAAGGYVDKPTLAVIGEAGPEAVVPLSGRNGANARNALGFGASIGGDADELAYLLQQLIEASRDEAEAARELASRPQVLEVNGRQAGELVKAGDAARKRL